MVMYSKWHGQACPVCFDGVLVDGEKSEEMTYQGAVFKYRQRGAFCPTCGNGIVEGGVENDALYKAFRNRVDVTIAEEIEAIREELHIPKAAMKNYIGGQGKRFQPVRHTTDKANSGRLEFDACDA